MNPYKICVYAICKNEASFVKRWADSMSEADLVIVCDTGSTDDTVQKLRENGVTTYEIKVSPWRFDEARNICLSYIPEDIDICICTDLDEIFEPHWRDKLESSWTPDTTQLRYTFVWSVDVNHKPLKTFMAEKIHSKAGYKWIYPVHEILEYSGTKPHCYTTNPDLHIFHYPDTSKSRSQYLPLLEYSAKLFPEYDRNIHYLGREYLYQNMPEKCIDTLKYHLTLARATWVDERSASMRLIGEAYTSLGDLVAAKSWFYRAIAEAPHMREPYLALVKFAYNQNDWPTVYHMVEEALKITSPTGSYLDNPESWGYLLYDFGAISCFYLEMKEKCLWFSRKALEHAPSDPRLQNNLKIAYTHFNEPLPD